MSSKGQAEVMDGTRDTDGRMGTLVIGMVLEHLISEITIMNLIKWYYNKNIFFKYIHFSIGFSCF